jgi:hypothetical protein
LGGAASGNNYRKTGRTMETLDLAGKSREELVTLLREGL